MNKFAKQIAWQKDVSETFATAVQHHLDMDPDQPFQKVKEAIIMSYLSDVQELMQMGNIAMADDMVNRVKYISSYETEGSVHNTLLTMDNQEYLDEVMG